MRTIEVPAGRHYANPVRVGDRVCDAVDPRHVGVVVEVFHVVRVRWEESGWLSDVRHCCLQIVEVRR